MTQALYAAPRGARAPLAYWNAFLDYLQTADHRATSASTPPERRGPRPIAGADEFETDVALYGADHFDTAAERRRKLALILRMPHPDEFERVAEALEHLALLEWARLPAVVRLDLMYVMKTAGAASSHEVNEREIAALLRLAEVSRDIGWLSTVEGIQHLDIDKRLRRRATEVREGLLNGSRVTTIDPSPQQIEYWNHARNDIRAGRAPTARAELLRTDVHLETERASEPRHLRPAPAPSCGHLFGPH